MEIHGEFRRSSGRRIANLVDVVLEICFWSLQETSRRFGLHNEQWKRVFWLFRVSIGDYTTQLCGDDNKHWQTIIRIPIKQLVSWKSREFFRGPHVGKMIRRWHGVDSGGFLIEKMQWQKIVPEKKDETLEDVLEWEVQFVFFRKHGLQLMEECEKNNETSTSPLVDCTFGGSQRWVKKSQSSAQSTTGPGFVRYFVGFMGLVSLPPEWVDFYGIKCR